MSRKKSKPAPSKTDSAKKKRAARRPPVWNQLNEEMVQCTQCPRLIQHCQNIGQVKRRAFAEEDYWARPVPNLGFARKKMLIVGLAPAAHGANRTGRMFTGDRSGDWLFRALHRAGFCNQPDSKSSDDGLVLYDCAITAVCHCAPPDNKPTTDEIANCRDFLVRTIDITNPKVFLALGKIGFDATVKFCSEQGWIGKPKPTFGHGKTITIDGGRSILASYHPSQQNTFTGRLTETMLDEIMYKAKTLCDL